MVCLDYQLKANVENIPDVMSLNDFTSEKLSKAIMKGTTAEDSLLAQSLSKEELKRYNEEQLLVGLTFKNIMKVADDLSKIVQATKADTQNGAAGQTIAHTLINQFKVNDLLQTVAEGNLSIFGVDFISSDITYKGDEEALREDLLNEKLPILQANFTLGVQEVSNLLGKYFPQYSEPFMKVIDSLRKLTKFENLDAKTMNNIYNDLFVYILSGKEFFGKEITSNKVITAYDRRKSFINKFPEEFKKIVSSNEDIAQLEFIKRLRVPPPSTTSPIDTIIFRNVGQLTASLKERYKRDWESLLYKSNPESQKLALNLVRYSFFGNGFSFGPSTFIHLLPMGVKLAIPEYISTIKGLSNTKDDYSNFVNQYVYNHLNNKRLVPEIPKDTSVKFEDQKGNIKEEVTFDMERNRTSGDKKVVKSKTMINGKPYYQFFRFISKKTASGQAYYRIMSSEETYSPTVAYKKIDPLGLKNNFIEYEYGEKAENINSAISNAKVKNVVDSIEDSNSVDETLPENGFTPVLPKEEAKALEEIPYIAYEQVFDTPLELNPKDENGNDLSFFSPNIDYKDAEDESICGTQILKR